MAKNKKTKDKYSKYKTEGRREKINLEKQKKLKSGLRKPKLKG
jgi:hypothetical protein